MKIAVTALATLFLGVAAAYAEEPARFRRSATKGSTPTRTA